MMALELDGLLVPHQRLLKLSAMEVLNFGYSHLMDGKDAKERVYIQAWLEGRVGPNGGIIVDDDDLPENLHGQEAPAWWNEGPQNPFSDTFTVPDGA